MNSKSLEVYEQIIAAIPEIERKGKANPYTSDNTYMFSLVNKDGEFGFRFSEARKKELIEELGASELRSYGAVMRGYVKIPEALYADEIRLIALLKESHQYVLSLPPQTSKKK